MLPPLVDNSDIFVHSIIIPAMAQPRKNGGIYAFNNGRGWFNNKSGIQTRTRHCASLQITTVL